MIKKRKKSKVERELLKYSKMYKRWKKVYCPVLKADVHFTRMGWGHLFERKKRSKIEILERVKLLPHAKKLLSITITLQKKRLQNNRQYYAFNAFTEGIHGAKIEVVVVQDKKKFNFFSVCKGRHKEWEW